MARTLEFQLQHQSFQGNTQDWFPLGWTGWISLQSKGLSRVFSNTTVWSRLNEACFFKKMKEWKMRWLIWTLLLTLLYRQVPYPTLIPITKVTSPQKPNGLCVLISGEVRRDSWVHCSGAHQRANLPECPGASQELCEATRPHSAFVRYAGKQRLLGEQSLKKSWQGDDGVLATSFWGFWNPSTTEVAETSTDASSALWLRIPNWSFPSAFILNFSIMKSYQIHFISVEK